jgi:peptidoglycan/LPS O-acetylase OafA/YrhL
MMFPFFCGLLLFRMNGRIRIPLAYPLLSALLLIVFVLPYAPDLKVNGALEALTVILVFPFMIAAGAGSQIGGRLKSLCSFFGRISYPAYITHYPFISIYTHWIGSHQPSALQSFTVAAGLLVWFIVLAYVAARFYDEPIREWLTARHRKKALAASQR